MRLNAAVMLLCSVALTACTSGTGTPADAGCSAPGCACASARDCSQTTPQVCVTQTGTTKVCVIVCSKSSDCGIGKVCEDGTCTSPGCGGPSDCAGGQICTNGSCGSQVSAVGSCVVTPNPAVVHAGAKLNFAALVKDLGGNTVPFSPIAWSTSSGTIDSAGILTAAAPAAGATGPTTVTATVGGKTCISTVTTYAAATDPLRVVAVDAHTKRPIVGAFVVIGSGPWTADTKKVTDASGMAIFANAGAAPRDVHAFAADHNYASYVGVSGADLLITLQPYVALANRSGFKGTITSDDFNKLNEKDQIVRLAFFGSGVANSILDFSLDTLIGPLRPVIIKLGGQTVPTKLPSGLVIGVGDDLFNTQDYTMYAEPGKRVLWGLGGNVDIAAVLKAAGPLLSGGTTANIDVGSLLPQLLPLLGKLQAGSVVGVEAGANAATPTFETKPVALNTPLRLRANTKAPDMPTVDGKYLDGIIALAGAAAYPMGFVPLGLTAGLSHKDTSGANTAKVDDPNCDKKGTVACNTSNLPLQLAATNNGMEGFPYGVVLLALNFGGLTPGSATGIAVSGIVKLQSEIKYTASDATPPNVDFGTRGFMALPNTNVITFTKATRKLVVNSDADASTQIYRFELASGSRLNWNVWMDKAGSGRTVTLFDPATVDASLVDPLVDNPSGRMIGIVTSDPTQNYAKLTGFGDITPDNIGNSLQAFSVIAITLQ